MHISIPRSELSSYWNEARMWIPTVAYAIGQEPAVITQMLETLVNKATKAQIYIGENPIITIAIEDTVNAPTTAPKG